MKFYNTLALCSLAAAIPISQIGGTGNLSNRDSLERQGDLITPVDTDVPVNVNVKPKRQNDNLLDVDILADVDVLRKRLLDVDILADVDVLRKRQGDNLLDVDILADVGVLRV